MTSLDVSSPNTVDSDLGKVIELTPGFGAAGDGGYQDSMIFG